MTDSRVAFPPRAAVINVCANIHSIEEISTAPNRNSDQIMGHHDKSWLFFQPRKLLSSGSAIYEPLLNLVVRPHRLVVKRTDTPKQNIYSKMGIFSENGLWTLTALFLLHIMVGGTEDGCSIQVTQSDFFNWKSDLESKSQSATCQHRHSGAPEEMSQLSGEGLENRKEPMAFQSFQLFFRVPDALLLLRYSPVSSL